MYSELMHRSTRRSFLGSLTVLFQASLLSKVSFAAAPPAEKTDEEVFLDAMAFARAQKLEGKPIGEVMTAFGRNFLGTPYVGHTLEAPGDEHLVINLREFDCVTFVENMLTLARCVKSGKTSFAEFMTGLAKVRYAGGSIDGYPSRLHYFSTWIGDNGQKGVVRDITRELGGTAYEKPIDFMTTHAGSYKQLERKDFVQRIKLMELELSRAPLHHIPKEAIGAMQDRLQDGDIIGTTTAMKGMDISHTGLAVREGGIVRFMHAPLSGKQVMISEGSLAEYVKGIASHTGIVAARPLEPQE
ncbi:MAG: DUF1460 domain-containing protein [Bacteroidetes bacterium]|nr:DUF1460 domain-containing protein [Bacteroidota bacterium]